MQTIKEIFKVSQHGLQSQAALIKNMTKLYDSMDKDKFFEEFAHCLIHVLIVFKREPVVERCVDFIAAFSTSLRHVGGCSSAGDEKNDNDETDDDMHPFLLRLFHFLLKHHNAQDKAVRFRVCQLVQKLLTSMGDDAAIDDNLYDKIYETMLVRLRDKFPAVRANAVLAMARLQDPTIKDCPIIEAYKFMLSCDQNSDVRRAVLSSIAASTRTLPAILDRVRDAKDSVRRTAYTIIADKVHVRALTIAQRVKLLQTGLNDRNDAVRDTCVAKLVRSWLHTYNDSALELLNCLDVENSLEVSQDLLAILFKRKATASEIVDEFKLLNDKLCIPGDKLTCENALYWRCLCEYIRSLGHTAEEQLDKILPNPLDFAEYLMGVVSDGRGATALDVQLRNEFILQQLVSLIVVMDLSDQVCRKRIEKLIRDLLLDDSVSHAVVKCLMVRYCVLHPEPEECSNSVAEIIADIREPMSVVEEPISKDAQRQATLKLAAIRVELNQLRDELDDCIQAQNFTRAAEIKVRIAALDAAKALETSNVQPSVSETRIEKTDVMTLLKCLSITTEMLTEPRLNKLVPSLLSMMENLILPCIQNKDPAVRNLAIRALSLCCLRDVNRSISFMLLFLKASRMDVETVRLTALHAVFDQLHFYGLQAFNIDEGQGEEEEEGEEGRSKKADRDVFQDSDDEEVQSEESNEYWKGIISMLTLLLDSESSEIRTVCAEGFAKLLLARRVVSPSLVSRLLLQWYNPVTEDDTRLRHCLGTFLPMYAFASSNNQAIVAEAFMPTLTTLFDAPDTSPLSEIKTANVAELLVQLTNSRYQTMKARGSDSTSVASEVCLHSDIAVKVANEILSDPNSFNVRVLVRVLTLLELSPADEDIQKTLRVLTERMLKAVKDKACTRMLSIFQRTVGGQPADTTTGTILNDKTRGGSAANSDGEDMDDIEKGVDNVDIEDVGSDSDFQPSTKPELKRASQKQLKRPPVKFIKTTSGRGGRTDASSKSMSGSISSKDSHDDVFSGGNENDAGASVARARHSRMSKAKASEKLAVDLTSSSSESSSGTEAMGDGARKTNPALRQANKKRSPLNSCNIETS